MDWVWHSWTEFRVRIAWSFGFCVHWTWSHKKGLSVSRVWRSWIEIRARIAWSFWVFFLHFMIPFGFHGCFFGRWTSKLPWNTRNDHVLGEIMICLPDWLGQAGRRNQDHQKQDPQRQTHEPILRKNDAASSFSHTEALQHLLGCWLCPTWSPGVEVETSENPSSGVLEPGSSEVSICLHLLTICLSLIPSKQARYATKSSSALGAVTSGSPSLSGSWSTPPPFART